MKRIARLHTVMHTLRHNSRSDGLHTKMRENKNARGRVIERPETNLEQMALFSISISVPSIDRFLSSSAKVVQTKFESWKVGRQVVSDRICLLRRVFSPKTFYLSSPVLNNADGNGIDRRKSNKQKNSVQTGSIIDSPICTLFLFLI